MAINLKSSNRLVHRGLDVSKILVSGASGFVGGHLLEALRVLDESEIVALFNKTIPVNSPAIDLGNLRWVRKDIVTDELEDVLKDIDLVIHLAGYSSVLENENTLDRLHSINVLGTRRIARAALNQGVSHLIFVSSVAAGELSNDVIVNESNGIPVSAYGRSKKAAEKALLEIGSRGLAVTILRPTALFGENHLGSLFELVRLIKKNRFLLFGTGENYTNFYYVKDFINDLLSVALNSEFYGKVFIVSDVPCALKDLVEKIKILLMIGNKTFRLPVCIGKLLGRLADFISQLVHRPLPLSFRRVNAMVRNVVYSSQLFRTELGMPISYGLDLGLKNTIEWYRESGFLE